MMSAHAHTTAFGNMFVLCRYADLQLPTHATSAGHTYARIYAEVYVPICEILCIMSTVPIKYYDS